MGDKTSPMLEKSNFCAKKNCKCDKKAKISCKNVMNRQNRKTLILKGARQVGKTYILKEFGKEEYEDAVNVGLLRRKANLDSRIVIVGDSFENRVNS